MEVGAVVKNPTGPTRYLVPWFFIRKEEGGGEKPRIISDCRKINKIFTAQAIQTISLKNSSYSRQKSWWAAKIDLQHAYFHLGLAECLQPYVTLLVGEELFQFKGACFGLNILPHN